MADYNSSLPIRTENAGDAIVKVADATIPSQQLKVEADGSINVNGSFSLPSGSEIKITDGTDDLAVNADGSINVVATATDLDIRDLDSAQDSVEVLQASHDNLNANANLQVGNADVANGNPVPVSDAGGSLTVDAADLDIRDLSSAQDSVEVLQSAHDDLNANANLQVANTDVSNSNPVPMSDAGGSLTVDAVDLDIRDLSSAQDSVEVLQSTHDDLNANANLQVANTDVSNANPVPMSDAGGSITVDATDLDIRDLSSAQDSVEVLQNTHDDLNANANLQVANTDVSNANPVPMSDAGGSLTVDAVDLDIRNLSASQDSVAANIRDEAGNAFSNSNPLPVAIVDVEGTEVNDYNLASAIAANASSNHDYAPSGAFKLRTIWASASGRAKFEVQIETGVSTNVFNTVFVAFNSTANPNIELPIRDAISVASGVRIRIIRTNRDNQSQDLYSTISGFLV